MGETHDMMVKRIAEKARLMRKHSLDMALVAGSNGAHLGPGYSMAEIMATLYFAVMKHDPKNPTWPDRDRLVLSKGHGVLGYYTALAEAGYFPVDYLKTFETKDSFLAGHPSINLKHGIETSTGSLGHGLSLGVGMALAAKMDKKEHTIYVYHGDGECDEGSVWEAIMSAVQFKLDNLVVIVDRNNLQSDGLSREIMYLGDLAEKWKTFGWHVREIDGHNVSQILDALHIRNRPFGVPYVIIAHTIKGKGVSFFESNNLWHHNKLTHEQYVSALRELGYDENGEDLKPCCK